LKVEEVAKPKPAKDQLLIKLQYAALNHRDLWIVQEQSKTPNESGVILGSDGAGVVESVGEDVDPLWIGAEVIVNPSLDWGSNPVVHGNQFRILGFPDAGTFAEYICISKKYVHEKPENLSMEESAAVPLSALTAYRALFSKARLRANEKVLVTSAGGGTAVWAVQMALSYQARVYVTSGNDEKLKKLKQLGVANGFNYKQNDWSERLAKEAGGFDIIIDGAGGDYFPKLLDLALPGGRIVNFGRTAGDIPGLAPRTIFWKQLSIHGTTMGTHDEFLSMIDFIESRNLKPIIDKVYPMAEFESAFASMKAADQLGKIILKVS